MGITYGTGPFGRRPAGRFNFDAPRQVLYWEDSPRWVRVLFHGETVADSRRVKLLHETGHQPVYYFPADDVRSELLEAVDAPTHCPLKGEARYWSVQVGDRVAERAVWEYPEPIAGAPSLAGYRAFYWDRMDAWFEEDEEVFVHPRDPYHRIDVLPSSRSVRISAGGELLAESDRPVLLFETGLPVRFYLPREDVRMELLSNTDTRTRCPYKGITSEYWSVEGNGTRVEDAAWAYADPLAAAGPIAGRIAFYDEKVEVGVEE